MKHYRKRVSKIADELLMYFFSVHATDVNIRVQELDEHYEISAKGNCPALTEEKAKKLIKLLSTPLHAELEEYYWELMGESDIDHELALIGMMSTHVEVNYQEGETLEIVLHKAKD